MAKYPDIALQTAKEMALMAPPFAKAPKARKLLEFLYEKRDGFVSGPDISREIWSRSKAQHDGEQVRERIQDLRRRLRAIQDVTDSSYYLVVPDAQPGKGYQLALAEKEGRKESAAFWRPHTKADDVTLVYAEPVFFYDVAAGFYIRYLDTNPVDLRAAVGELERRHGKELENLCGTLALADHLAPRAVYVGTGEVGAMAMLAEWFLRRSLLTVERQASSRVSHVQEGCPVLIGSERTNWLIEKLLNSEEGQHFAYRQDRRIGFISIREAQEKDIAERERAALRKRYSVSEEEGQTIAGNKAELPAVRDRLAIVHRMPTPEGKGTITMISSDTSLAIQQVALALTDDGQAGAIMDKTGWTETTLPKSFEMLFGVRISPANIEHGAGDAELLGWRNYP